MECTICLGALRSPCALPCGHLHCTSCVTDYLAKSDDAVQGRCPTCRSTFSLVTPNLDLVPAKYHKFISPAVRRVYLDDANADANAEAEQQVLALTTENEQLRRRVTNLDREKTQLMDSAEANIRRAHACAQGERRAIVERDAARQEVARLLREVDAMKNTLAKQQTTQQARVYLKDERTLASLMNGSGIIRNHADLSSSPPHRAGKKPRVDDDEFPLFEDDSLSSDFFEDYFPDTQDFCRPVPPSLAASSSSRANPARPTKPLPKRIVTLPSRARAGEPNLAHVDDRLERVRTSLLTLRRVAADDNDHWQSLARYAR